MTVGGRADPGEELLGVLLDGAHELPPHLVGPLVAETMARVGGRDPQIRLQDSRPRRSTPRSTS